MTSTSKVWFLTGATSNFGIALTRLLLKHGHCVVATSRTPSKLPFTEDESEALLILQLDVSDLPSIPLAFEKAMARFGRIDVVVNKAGGNLIGELEGFAETEARDLFDTQFWGPARVQDTAMEIFESQKSQGLILNITSPGAVFPGPLGSIMCASKAASEVFTLARAQSLPFVTAVNVRPGGFEDSPNVSLTSRPTAYSAKDVGRTVAGTMRSMMSKPPPGIGDVNKMVKELLIVAESPREQLPSTVLFGSESYGVNRAIALKQRALIQQSQHLLNSVKNAGPGAQNARVWFVGNADSTFGQTLVRVLLASDQRVVSTVPSNKVLPSTVTDDRLLVVRPEGHNTSAFSTVLTDAVEHFGKIDVVVNAPPDEAELQEDDWESARAVADRIFWSSMNMSSASVKVLREHNLPGAGGRIFNLLTTTRPEDAIASAFNTAVTLGTTALVRELPRKWSIGASAVTIDSDLQVEDQTARALIALADLPRSELPSQLSIGSRALAIAQHAAEIELTETCSKESMARAMKTNRDHIDSRARIGFFESTLALVLSPAPSPFSMFWLVLCALGWGIRMAVVESIRRLSLRS